MTENEFLLQDRITKIQSINSQLNLKENSYIAFSGGKDSTVVHHLIDMALPNNKIPRVFINTGLEYKQLESFVKDLANQDERFIILQNKLNIRTVLETYGYPCKSKEHATKVEMFNKGSNAPSLAKYASGIDFKHNHFSVCNPKLLHHFSERGKYNYSAKCCVYMKERPSAKWAKRAGKKIVITGVRKDEGGRRRFISCLTEKKEKFNPLAIVSDEWEQWFIDFFGINLCELYYPPYSFRRTGCIGCPFNMLIKDDLDKMAVLMPEERKRAELLWGDVYDDYRKSNYRLVYEKPLNYREKHSLNVIQNQNKVVEND